METEDPMASRHTGRFLVMAWFALGMSLSSCLKDLPESLPKEVDWNPELAFPLGQDRFGLNPESGFDTALFQLDTLTGLPQWVNEVEIVLEGSIEFDLSSLNESLDDLQAILFRVNVYNGFPNEAHAQAYFMDAASGFIDSMFREGAIAVPPGRLLGNGESMDPSAARRDARFDGDRLEALQDATGILLRATLKNPEIDTSLIPWYPDYYIEVDIGAMLDLSLSF
jgi:hypothetical protein